MAKIRGSIVVDIEKCKGCGLCVVSCSSKVLTLSANINKKGFNYCEMQNDKCIACKACALVCPDAVITVYKAKSTGEEK